MCFERLQGRMVVLGTAKGSCWRMKLTRNWPDCSLGGIEMARRERLEVTLGCGPAKTEAHGC